MKIGFDNQKYLKLQSERILERVAHFGGKLYLEFGGKLFDDYHASRVLPGFQPDSKMKVLLQLKEQAEIVIAINAAHIEMNKRRGDLGITYRALCRQRCHHAVRRPAGRRGIPAQAGGAGRKGLPALPNRRLSLKHQSHCLRRWLWQKRVYRNQPPHRHRHGPRPRLGQNGDLPQPALSGTQARRERRLCQI